MPPFRLLNLPYCAIVTVLDHVNPNELLIISICSRKVRKLIKSAKCSSKNVELELSIGRNDIIVAHFHEREFELIEVVKKSRRPRNRILDTERIGDFRVPVRMGSECFKTYWKDRCRGIKEIGSYTMKIFGKPIHILEIGTVKSKDDPKWITDWINQVQESIACCSFSTGDDVIQDEDFTYFLTNTLDKTTEEFVFYGNLSNDFRHTVDKPLEMNKVYLGPSKWITQDHLLIMNCQLINIDESSLNNRDINVFLNHWKNGGCPKLKEIIVEIQESVNYDIVLEGIEIDRTDDQQLVRHFTGHENYEITIHGRNDIHKGDQTAHILDYGDSNEFHMIVWPDWDEEYYENVNEL